MAQAACLGVIEWLQGEPLDAVSFGRALHVGKLRMLDHVRRELNLRAETVPQFVSDDDLNLTADAPLDGLCLSVLKTLEFREREVLMWELHGGSGVDLAALWGCTPSYVSLLKRQGLERLRRNVLQTDHP